MFFKEQEEELNAEGVSGTAQDSHLDTTHDRDFLCGDDDGRDNESPGPKFRSLRHLRQVNSC